MPAARYWRLIGVETYIYRADLELAGVALYDGSTRHAVTPTSVIAPTSGSLANLSDGNVNTSCRFDGLSVPKPGFALVWDFGVAKSVNKVEVWATAAANFIYKFELQQSDDKVSWTPTFAQSGIPFPGAKNSFWVDMLKDAIWGGVVLLLHANGSNGSTTIVDSSLSARAVTTNGGQLTTGQAKFGTSSLLCGSGISYDTTLPALTGDFAVEFWARHSSSPYMSTLVNIAGGYPSGLILRQVWSTSLEVWIGGSSNIFTFAPGVGQWHFHQLTRTNGVFTIYIDGVQIGAFSNSTQFPSGGFKIGQSAHSSGEVFVGTIDDLRVTAGYGRSSNIPSQEFGEGAGASSTPVTRILALVEPPAVAISSYMTPSTRVVSQPKGINVDMEDGGEYQIAGTVKESSSPADIPIKRRVRLFNEDSGRLVREVWSDPATGAYQFAGIKGNTKYTVVCHDYTLAHRAVVADRIVPVKIS